MLSINLSTKIQDVGHLLAGDARLVTPYCCLEPPTSSVSFERSYDFNISSPINFLKTSSHNKIFDQYNFNIRNYYDYFNIVSCSLIILQIIHTMLHPPKLLIYHNYKRILYHYKTFPNN